MSILLKEEEEVKEKIDIKNEQLEHSMTVHYEKNLQRCLKKEPSTSGDTIECLCAECTGSAWVPGEGGHRVKVKFDEENNQNVLVDSQIKITPKCEPIDNEVEFADLPEDEIDSFFSDNELSDGQMSENVDEIQLKTEVDLDQHQSNDTIVSTSTFRTEVHTNNLGRMSHRRTGKVNYRVPDFSSDDDDVDYMVSSEKSSESERSDAEEDESENDMRQEKVIENERNDTRMARNAIEGAPLNADQSQPREAEPCTSTSSTTKPFKCSICKKAYVAKDNLKIHFRLHSGERPFSCSICEKTFITQDHCKRHQLTHQSDRARPHVCTHCGAAFTARFKLNRHLRLHSENGQSECAFQCSVCGKGFKRNDTFKNHEQTHDPDRARSYVCGDCGSAFFTLEHLTKHQITHKKVKFPCSICGKGYSSKEYLKVHEESHIGKKACVCPICGSVFPSSKALETHKVIHSDESYFHCSTCGKSFTKKCNLKLHQEKSHKIIVNSEELLFACGTCGKPFSQREKMEKHQLLHREKECPLCKMVFTQRCLLKRHQQKFCKQKRLN